MGTLEGKVTLVTGVGAGIGAAIVRRYCSEGAMVIGTDVDHASGSATMAAAGGHFQLCDVGDTDAVRCERGA